MVEAIFPEQIHVFADQTVFPVTYNTFPSTVVVFVELQEIHVINRTPDAARLVVCT